LTIEQEIVLGYLRLLAEKVIEKNNIYTVKFNNSTTKFYGTEKRFCFNKQIASDIGADYIDKRSSFFKDIVMNIMESMNIFCGRIEIVGNNKIQNAQKRSVKDRIVFLLDFEYKKIKKGMPEWTTTTIVIDEDTGADVTELLHSLLNITVIDSNLQFKRDSINGVISAGYNHLQKRKQTEIEYENSELEAERAAELAQRQKNLDIEFKALEREHKKCLERISELKNRINHATKLQSRNKYQTDLKAAEGTLVKFLESKNTKTKELDRRFNRLTIQMEKWYIIERAVKLVGVAAISFKEEQAIIEQDNTEILVRNSPFSTQLEYQCPHCQNFAIELYKCKDHLICKFCSTICICSEKVCREHGNICRACGLIMCPNCNITCVTCNRIACKNHSKKTRTGISCLLCIKTCEYCNHEEALFEQCNICNISGCQKCIEECVSCKKQVCPSCRKNSEDKALCVKCGYNCVFCDKWSVTRKCSECNCIGCHDHSATCNFCNEPLCQKHIQLCQICNKIICAKHTNICRSCKKTYCKKHMVDENCRFCKQLEESPYDLLPKHIKTQINVKSRITKAKLGKKIMVCEKGIFRNKYQVFTLDKND